MCDHYQTLPSKEAGVEGEDRGRRRGRERAADSRKERGEGNIGGRNFALLCVFDVFLRNDNKGILYLGVQSLTRLPKINWIGKKKYK